MRRNRSSGGENRSKNARHDEVCAEWTGVLLSTLLKECGLKGGHLFISRSGESSEAASEHAVRKA